MASAVHPYSRMTLNQLLVELDGYKELEGVVVIGATNFPESLDKWVKREGGREGEMEGGRGERLEGKEGGGIEGGRDRQREGGKERWREGKEGGGIEGGRARQREGGKERWREG